MSFNIPTNYLMKDSFNKHLLRLSSKNLVIDKIRLNREKKDLMLLLTLFFLFKIKNLKSGFLTKTTKMRFIIT